MSSVLVDNLSGDKEAYEKTNVLAVLSVVAVLLLAPIAFGQEEEVSEEVEIPDGGEAEIEVKGPPEVVEPAVQ